jgi:hypothetical protein
MVEGMHATGARLRRSTAPAAGLLIALTVFGVLLMHSAHPVMSMPAPTGAADASMASPWTHESSVPVAFGEHHNPSAHQMMHPCLGTTASWPALIAPIADKTSAPTTPTNGLGHRIDGAQERAPPWALWELDESVTLRV